MYLNSTAEADDWPGLDFFVYMMDVKVLAIAYQQEFDYGIQYKRIREGGDESHPLWTIGRVCLWPYALFTGHKLPAAKAATRIGDAVLSTGLLEHLRQTSTISQ